MGKKWERKKRVSRERMSKQGRIEMQSKTKGERIPDLSVNRITIANIY